ncbi:hypothetical protein Fmac_002903 [Flemingia macrophylla]|uniref:Survival Motor Neuron Gemin2-binding domain-containing protein n=1 Tax=Flemingia macrophylla TaxID=520843 RepID=A0ABD1NN00_9FABA
MGKKEGDLWDDSALINAFDQAISTYKKMHSTAKHKHASPETVIAEDASDAHCGTIGYIQLDADTDGYIPATDAPDSGEAGDVLNLEENHHAESAVEQPCLDSTSGQVINSAQNVYAYEQGGINSVQNSYASVQGLDDYNQLLAQYYELEEKRVRILEQLNQYGGWNYQNVPAASSSGVQCYNSQDYSMSTYQVSDPNAVCTCCPCYTQCSLAPCTSVPGCSLGGSSVGKPCNNLSGEMDRKMSFPCEDGKIQKMAMGAAEKALSTIRTTISGDLNVNEEEKGNNSQPEEINGSEADLADVLNAWYSAGFYTGK